MLRRCFFAILTVAFLIPLGCSDTTSPPPPPEPKTLTVTPASAPPGSIVKIAGAGLDAAALVGISLTIGGQPSLVRAQGADLVAAIPLFMATGAKAPAPPAGALDLELRRGDKLIGAAREALTITALPAAPGAATAVSSDLEAVATNVGRFVTALGTEPSLEVGYMSAWIGALDEVFAGDHAYSLPTALGELESGNPETLALIESIFAASGLAAQSRQMAAYSSVLADEAEKLQARDTKTTDLLDYRLALRMQFYVVMRDFGADVIAETNQTWSNTVGLVSGVIGIGGVSVAPAAVVSAGLALGDFALNKVATAYLPSRITSFEITLTEPLIAPGDVPQTELWLNASNTPTPIGIQDFIDLLLLGLGQAGGGDGPETFRDFLTATADFFLGFVRSLIGAYAGTHPELQIDIDLASIPAMSWRTEVTSDRYAELSTLTPDIINPVNNILAWRAELDGSGEGRIFARPASGPGVTTLPMPPGYTYNAGAFGDDISATPTVSVFVGNQLVVETSMSSSISPEGENGLEIRAGYRSPTGAVVWAEGVQIQCSADGGTVSPATGVTGPDGRFDTFVSLDSGSTSVTVTATATGDFGQQQTREVTATHEGLDIALTFPEVITPGVPATLGVTVTATGDVTGIRIEIEASDGEVAEDEAVLGAGGTFSTTVIMYDDINTIGIEVTATSDSDDKISARATVEATRPDQIQIVGRGTGGSAQVGFYYEGSNPETNLWVYNATNRNFTNGFEDFSRTFSIGRSGWAEGMFGTGTCVATINSDIQGSEYAFSGVSFFASANGTGTLNDPHDKRYGLSTTSGADESLTFMVWGTTTGSFTLNFQMDSGPFVETYVTFYGETFVDEEEFEICFENGVPCDKKSGGPGSLTLLYDAEGKVAGAQGALPPGEYELDLYGGGYIRFSDNPSNPASGTAAYDVEMTASLSVSQ